MGWRGVSGGLRTGGSEEARALARRQAQRLGQQRHALQPRRAGRVALQLADGLHAEAGALGQRLLG